MVNAATERLLPPSLQNVGKADAVRAQSSVRAEALGSGVCSIGSSDTDLASVTESCDAQLGVPDMRFIRKERSTLAKEMLRPLRLDTDYAKYQANDGGVVGNIRRGLDVLFGTEDEPKQPRKQGA